MKWRLSALTLQISVYTLAISWWLWSFTQTDRSLYYSSHPVWVGFQQFMWQTPRVAAVVWYVGMILIAFGLYLYIQRTNHLRVWSTRLFCTIFILPVSLLLLSNNALSYDLFNYIFDARLVIHYHLDPHLTSAISYQGVDDWTRFMRNVFFPTTYGYMWTALSLVPYILGVGKFLTTFIFFKLYMVLGIGLLFVLQKNMGAKTKSLLMLFGNPLFLLEIVLNGHNDIWMMVLAFGSLVLLIVKTEEKFGRRWLLKLAISFALLYASAQVKRSTALLLPVWLLLALDTSIPFLNLTRLDQRVLRLMDSVSILTKKWWADVAAILLFLPLCTELSRQFHPWYLLWSLSFLPFVRSSYLRQLLIVFSFTSLLRYVPVLVVGEYSEALLLQMKIITWSAVPVTTFWWLLLGIRGVVTRKVRRNV